MRGMDIACTRMRMPIHTHTFTRAEQLNAIERAKKIDIMQKTYSFSKMKFIIVGMAHATLFPQFIEVGVLHIQLRYPIHRAKTNNSKKTQPIGNPGVFRYSFHEMSSTEWLQLDLMNLQAFSRPMTTNYADSAHEF